ncbi:MAG: C69 family dipeptidase [Planctomycetes bacterium]|nr:C69 family dipeptidase [Planctomycetota bacterium]
MATPDPKLLALLLSGLLAACAQAPAPSAPPAPAAPRALPVRDDAVGPDSCTSIMVGRLATTDGSVITSHTCDANYRTWVRMVPAADHEPDSTAKVYRGRMHTEFPDDLRGIEVLGEIPQVEHTYAYLDTAYPCINEHQLAMGETTFGGRKELRSERGIFQVEELQRFALERCSNARDAIRLMGELALQYGYNDSGECLTVADPSEVWQFEIVGPGAGRLGAVWAAVRIPDGHVGISANISRIGRLELADTDRYMASPNVVSQAVELGLYDPDGGEPFVFWKAYGGERPFGPREFYVLSTLAPSLDLDYDTAEELPFSVAPERKLSVRDVMAFFRQTYQGHRFELTQNLMVANGDGHANVSPHVSPWLDRSEQALLNTLRPGAVEFFRPIPVMYNAYNTIIQCRGWLPDPIGGVCWLGFDNPAITPRAPIYCGVTELPPDYAVCDQHRFRMDSAAWAFRRVARLASIKWGDHAAETSARIDRYEQRALADMPEVERRALELWETDRAAARAVLTDYSDRFCRAMTHDYREFGDALWMSYRFRM